MIWISLSLISAALLGIYDVVKKNAVSENVVAYVLWISAANGAVIWFLLAVAMGSGLQDVFPHWLHLMPLDWTDHARLFGKAILVGASWSLALYALKYLPLSIAAPIRSTSPLMTIVLAIVWMGERPTWWQWIGMIIVLGSFWALSLVGRCEGIRFHRDRWVAFMLVATALGACSSIYDKVLLQQFRYPPATVQAWFTWYTLPVMTPVALATLVSRSNSDERFLVFNRREHQARERIERFKFRWSILAISPLLLIADMTYFTAVADGTALVSVISTLRRCSVIVVLILAKGRTGELNLRLKWCCAIGMILGVALIVWSGQHG
ncbi:MAG: DMT family transporter [Planctomycetota bacterium]